MAKIVNDKYYTPRWLAKRLIDKTYEIIGLENISETIEPSAGDGAFSEQIYHNVCLAYDIEPEANGIIKQDFLKLDCGYLECRLIIGNPPFGDRMNLAKQFYKKSVLLGDYIAFILPISQLDNSASLYEFDLIYSEDLGLVKYSGINLHCCFNIYKRNHSGINEKPDYKLNDVEVKEYRRNGSYKKPTNWDYAICSWGNGSCGNKVEYVGQYAQEQYITITNEFYRDAIMKVCETTDWKNLYNSVAGKKIQTWKIYKYLKEQIPELK